MAGPYAITISQLPNAGTLAGTETIFVMKSDGNLYKTTSSALLTATPIGTILAALTPTQIIALLNAAAAALPVYSGSGAAPVATGNLYIDVNGNVKVAG